MPVADRRQVRRSPGWAQDRAHRHRPLKRDESAEDAREKDGSVEADALESDRGD